MGGYDELIELMEFMDGAEYRRWNEVAAHFEWDREKSDRMFRTYVSHRGRPTKYFREHSIRTEHGSEGVHSLSADGVEFLHKHRESQKPTMSADDKERFKELETMGKFIPPTGKLERFKYSIGKFCKKFRKLIVLLILVVGGIASVIRIYEFLIENGMI